MLADVNIAQMPDDVCAIELAARDLVIIGLHRQIELVAEAVNPTTDDVIVAERVVRLDRVITRIEQVLANQTERGVKRPVGLVALQGEGV